MRDVGHRYLADRTDDLRQLVASDAVMAEQRGAELEQVTVGLVEHRVASFSASSWPLCEQRLPDRVALIDRCADGRRLGERGRGRRLVAAMSSGRGLRSAMRVFRLSAARSPEG